MRSRDNLFFLNYNYNNYFIITIVNTAGGWYGSNSVVSVKFFYVYKIHEIFIYN